MNIRTIFSALAIILVNACTQQQQQQYTRGIGVYPGNPDDYTGPEALASSGSAEQRNLALNRAAWSSSNRDYNLTAHLVTDGIVADTLPVFDSKDYYGRPSSDPEKFVSCWMPSGVDSEWLQVDLGAVSKIEKLCYHWIGEVPSGRVEVSSDLKKWDEVAEIGTSSGQDVKCRGRYVRIVIDKSSGEMPCALSEFEVLGRGGVTLKCAAQPSASEGKLNLRGGNWCLQRANLVQASPSELSSPGFAARGWLPATVPGTVLTSYSNDGAVPDQNYDSDQLQLSESFFLSDFWYRDEFVLPEDFGEGTALLNFDGINWKADVWMNGHSLGTIEGAFIRGSFDVSDIVKAGDTNAVAVLIHRPDHPGYCTEQTPQTADPNGGLLGLDSPSFLCSIGWDWIPTVRGRNIGIWNDVTLTSYKKGVVLDNPFVTTALSEDRRSADVSASVGITNRSVSKVSGTLSYSIGSESASCEVELSPGESREIPIGSVRLDNPELWWPAGYGRQYLYDSHIEFVSDGSSCDRLDFKTGIRELTYDDSDGSLDIYVNGRRLIGNGGNWGFPEISQNFRAREYDAAVRYHADMGFTMIRNWVGQTGDMEFYEACDKYGVMVWQDFWLANPCDGPDPTDEDMFEKNAADYILRIRNHPCIALYCGRNEGMPPASLDAFLKELVHSQHPGIPYIPHSADGTVSGYGPYCAKGPDAYFALTAGRSTLHSERGMPNVATAESLRRMLREENQWPQNKVWALHDFVLGSGMNCGTFNGFISDAFGEPDNLDSFARWAQWVNYDGYRAIFESRGWERKGVLLWMSHPCWPSNVWQTYDYYFEPNAAYFGAKKGSAPVRVQFNPETSQVEVVNNCAGNLEGLSVKAEILDMYGNAVWSDDAVTDSPEDTTVPVFDLKFDQEQLTDVFYIKLSLSDCGKTIADNFYVRGKEYYNFKKLLELGKPSVSLKYRFVAEGEEYRTVATVRNDGSVPALMIRLNLVQKGSSRQILPVIYQDNYFSLMPGESREVAVSCRREDTGGHRPALALYASHSRKVPTFDRRTGQKVESYP